MREQQCQGRRLTRLSCQRVWLLWIHAFRSFFVAPLGASRYLSASPQASADDGGNCSEKNHVFFLLWDASRTTVQMCFVLLANCAIDLCKEVTFIYIYIYIYIVWSLTRCAKSKYNVLSFAQKYWFVVGLCNMCNAWLWKSSFSISSMERHTLSQEPFVASYCCLRFLWIYWYNILYM